MAGMFNVSYFGPKILTMVFGIFVQKQEAYSMKRVDKIFARIINFDR